MGVSDYPQLRQIAWQLRDDTYLTEEEALHLYERNWRHVDRDAMGERERDFVQHLADKYSHGRLLVLAGSPPSHRGISRCARWHPAECAALLLRRRYGNCAALRRGLREVRVDQYGILTLIEIDGEAIKFEIVHEGRIMLDEPSSEDSVCGVATLSVLDMATTKLLANADRWADRGVHSRDVIDLAMMELPRDLLTVAIARAAVPYGRSVRDGLNRAVALLREDPHRLDECQAALKMQGVPKAVLWQRIKGLRG